MFPEDTWRVISRVTILIPHIRGPLTPLITTPKPPSTSKSLKVWGLGFRVMDKGMHCLQAPPPWTYSQAFKGFVAEQGCTSELVKHLGEMRLRTSDCRVFEGFMG